MKREVFGALAAALVLAGAVSCAQTPAHTDDPPAMASVTTPVATAPIPVPVAEPSPPRMVTAPAGDDGSELSFSAAGPAVTETLEKTVDMLLQAKADNERLKASLTAAEQKLTEKDQKIQQLTSQLDVASGDVTKLEEALEKWKTDVLGFRDEMRQADEAEIQVLQEVLTLLKGFAKEKPAQ